MNTLPPREEILRRIRKVVLDILSTDEAKLSNSSRFQDDLGADSLDMVTMLMALEDEFGRQISDEEAEQLTTIDATADFIVQNFDTLPLQENP
ncbi:MAG: acyl carrier protein [Chitinivibrionales bacterium]|nr:acyl carrier protein [Chitinivibrionales bacterium]